MVLAVNDIKISSSLKKSIKQELKKGMRITINKCFKEVLLACAAPRQNNEGTWITSDIIRVYQELNKRNFAHSVEIWQNDELVGGLWREHVFSKAQCFQNCSSCIIKVVENTWGKNH
jgi:leucyl/phenylalanyl-tRNA--protein transferase